MVRSIIAVNVVLNVFTRNTTTYIRLSLTPKKSVISRKHSGCPSLFSVCTRVSAIPQSRAKGTFVKTAWTQTLVRLTTPLGAPAYISIEWASVIAITASIIVKKTESYMAPVAQWCTLPQLPVLKAYETGTEKL